MCGIAGVMFHEPAPSDMLAGLCERMNRCIAHRGPDHTASWIGEERVALGYRRLAIVDLSPDGNQPVFAHDGRLVMVFNGEIYNHIEIRAELQQLGVWFRGHSDTEVLLAAIDRWGLETALAKSAGMFAFALWDGSTRVLRLVRDRSGKKPLYYAQAGGALYFASEIKSIRDGARVPVTIDHESLHHYLTLSYIPGPRTAYREIVEVPPGSWLEVTPGGRPSIKTYWTLPAPAEQAPIEDVDAELERLLSQAIRQRMRADVEVGIFLSGGIDSGLIAALAQRETSTPVRAFTIAFDDPAHDETEHATAVARHLGVNHEVIRVTPDVQALLPKIAAAYDEPFGDSSAIPTYAVSRAAAERVKVVLNGEGADELFGGYRRQLAMWRLAPYAAAASQVPGLSALADSLPAPTGFRTPYSLFYRAARGIGLAPLDRYIVWGGDGFTEEEKARLMPDSRQRATTAALGEQVGWPLHRGLVGDFMALDFMSMLADCLLVKIDIATMAHSLEGRSPFLDHRLVEWAARLPRSAIFSAPGTKPLLRKLASKLLPPQVVTAPKRGFEIPMRRWTRGELAPMIRDVCLDPNGVIASMMDISEVRALLDHKWPLDEDRWSKRVWYLLMLGLWGLDGERLPR